MTRSTHTPGDSRDDVIGSLALLLIVGAVIGSALWVGMAAGAHHGSPVALVGIAAIACLAASIACFAASDGDR